MTLQCPVCQVFFHCDTIDYQFFILNLIFGSQEKASESLGRKSSMMIYKLRLYYYTNTILYQDDEFKNIYIFLSQQVQLDMTNILLH